MRTTYVKKEALGAVCVKVCIRKRAAWVAFCVGKGAAWGRSLCGKVG